MQTIICKWEGSNESARLVVSSARLDFSLCDESDLKRFLMGIRDAFDALGEAPDQVLLEIRNDSLTIGEAAILAATTKRKRGSLSPIDERFKK